MKPSPWSQIPVAIVLAVSALSGSIANAKQYPVTEDGITEWCNDSMSDLSRAEQTARMVYSTGRYRDAKNILISGLVNASSRPLGWGSHGPITAKAIQRVRDISIAIDRSVSSSELGDRTSVVFLFEGYSFVRKVSRDLDIPYQVPYYWGPHRDHCRDCSDGDFDIEAYEKAFVTYATEQLDLVVNGLTLGSGDRGGMSPLGDPKAVLKALEIAASASAYDVRNSLWATHFACEIAQLRGLSMKLAAFNSGDRSLYRSSPEAFYATVSEAQYLSTMISEGLGCSPFNYQRDDGGYDPSYGNYNSKY